MPLPQVNDIWAISTNLDGRSTEAEAIVLYREAFNANGHPLPSIPFAPSKGKEHILGDSLTLRDILGDLHTLRITFVSLTGNRFTLIYRKDNLRFKGRPTFFQKCSCSHCTNGAFVKYERPLSPKTYIVCPKHIPQGVVSTFTEKADIPSALLFVSGCDSCKDDATEVIGITSAPTTMWPCQTCNAWWLLTESFVDDTLMSKLLPSGYRLDDTRNIRVATCDGTKIYIKPKPFTKIKEAVATYYDYVKADDLDI